MIEPDWPDTTKDDTRGGSRVETVISWSLMAALAVAGGVSALVLLRPDSPPPPSDPCVPGGIIGPHREASSSSLRAASVQPPPAHRFASTGSDPIFSAGGDFS